MSGFLVRFMGLVIIALICSFCLFAYLHGYPAGDVMPLVVLGCILASALIVFYEE